jgi:hypothetical protein
MKQVVQNLGSGVLELLDVPCPQVSRGKLLIPSRARNWRAFPEKRS